MTHGPELSDMLDLNKKAEMSGESGFQMLPW